MIAKISFFLLVSCLLSAQPALKKVSFLPFIENGKVKKDPFMGGLNRTSISQYDFNNDGFLDLYIFDDQSNKSIIMLNDKKAGKAEYTSSTAYEHWFPKDMKDWAFLKDFNCDGVPDLFTNGLVGMRILKGKKVNNKLSFTTFTNTIRAEDTGSSTELLTLGTCSRPLIIDINSDGFLDILLYKNTDIGVNPSITYYKNKGVSCDSFSLKIKSNCWGKVKLIDSPDFGYLPNQCGGAATDALFQYQKGGMRHCLAKNLIAFDEDLDGDYEMVTSAEVRQAVAYGKNMGHKDFGNLDSVTRIFPPSDVTIPYRFSNGEWIDIDNDSKKDLVVSTITLSYGTDNYYDKKHISFYKKNTNSFNLANNDFL
jgi:hypothetical protein